MNPSSKLTSRLALLAIAGTLSACSTMQASNSGPTFQDYLSIQDAMHAYHYGLDNRDNKLKASAFTKDGRLATVVEGKEVGVEYPNQPEKNGGGMPGAPGAGGPPSGGFPGGAPPAGGPPQGAPGGAFAGGPPPGGAGAGGPPPGGAGGAGAGGPPPGGAGGFQMPKGELWHLGYPGHIKFESATRATHYGYWTSLYSEAKGPRDSQVGSPGHYEDVFEKQPDGRWLFTERKVVVGTKK